MSDNQTVISRSHLVPVEGVLLEDHIATGLDAVSAFCPHPSDLLVIAYPKSGSTWTLEIIDLLLHKGDVESCRRAPITIRTTFLEATIRLRSKSGVDQLKEMDPPRVIKTHLPFQLVPLGFWEKKCKTIYVARNAKDTLVSFYYFHHMNKTCPEPGTWDDFIHKFMRDELQWGSWYDHVKRFWEEREKRNILYLFYEDMKENPRREVARIMRYLDLSLSDDVISRIVELTTFKKMKENPMANYTFLSNDIYDQSISNFIRKGEVGDWKNHFTAEQAAEFDEDYKKKMKQVNIPFKTQLLQWGSWYDHVKGYWEEREKRNILYIFYEDMKENPQHGVDRIMRYLDLSLSDDVIRHIVELTSFKNMKANPMANYTFVPKIVFDQSNYSFMRKGHSTPVNFR
ncbi:sulfotransferase 1 family member D1-like [Phyllopteryx taeniolatus]|uniref:sulfotransferase 1 family member D1-like n=1 Tax=Phyllopteryx taeniolatus TaxID=161469 RepID=UPI002AD23103|nr:sulfotransferase 1 family member D1-like [Phyllopteryx taeniolatus]